MAEMLIPGLYRIGVRLPDSPLKELNAYLFKGAERDLFGDTGFRVEECRESLLSGLDELSVDRDKLDIILTHLHADHSGLAAEVAGESSSIYMHPVDLERLKGFGSPSKDSRNDTRNRFLKEGFAEERLVAIDDTNPMYKLSPKKAWGNRKGFK